MTQDQLQQFFHEKKEKAMPTDINWAAKRDAWIGAVKELYRTIEHEYLSSVKNDVEITFPEKVIKENYIGEYKIPEFNIRVGDEQVIFSPKGINLFGAKGRIDVQGDRGEAMIIWQEGNAWSIVVSRVPKVQLIPFTAATFADMLKDIMRP
jgi:hypothetical protein